MDIKIGDIVDGSGANNFGGDGVVTGRTHAGWWLVQYPNAAFELEYPSANLEPLIKRNQLKEMRP